MDLGILCVIEFLNYKTLTFFVNGASSVGLLAHFHIVFFLEVHDRNRLVGRMEARTIGNLEFMGSMRGQFRTNTNVTPTTKTSLIIQSTLLP